MYGYRFLSRGFTHRREILQGGSATSQTCLLLFWGITPSTAEFWASTGAIWRDMLLARALVNKSSTGDEIPERDVTYLLSVWNSLTADIVDSSSLAIFKRKLKTFLFRQAFSSS